MAKETIKKAAIKDVKKTTSTSSSDLSKLKLDMFDMSQAITNLNEDMEEVYKIVNELEKVIERIRTRMGI
jgi:methyl-accepting chemotaxis protein